MINGLKAGKGVKAVKLDLVDDKVPKVIIIGTPRLIPEEVKKAWGLVDSEWEEDKHGKVVIDVEMLE